MKHILSMSLLIMVLVFVFGCYDDLGLESGNANFDEGELTECKLNVETADFGVSSETRTSTPDTIGDKTASVQENAIDNIWVFQYDTSDNALIKPRYYHKEESSSGNWSVLLKEGVESTIYVVANTNDSTWATTLADFDTLNELKAQTIPNPDPIDPNETPTFYIPMQGCVSNTTVDLSASSTDSTITVPVERMFAKLMISTSMEASSMTLKSVMVSNIPITCRVESQSCGDGSGYTDKEDDAGTYSSDYNVWSVEAQNTTSSGTTTEDSISTLSSDIIIYIPENIQGEVEGASSTTGAGVPDRALAVSYTFKISIEADTLHPDKEVEGGNTEGSVTVYPGSNSSETNLTNFNVKRNRIYKIKAKCESAEYFAPSASANCMIVVPGETLTFWPYYRLETGGGYNIKSYLNPTDTDLTIDSVAIIWQDEDVIGDNSKGDKVQITSYNVDNIIGTTDYDTYLKKYNQNADSAKYYYLRDRTRILVKTSGAEGNALIGGYNKKGEIIWSWHIWVTDNDPANVGNAEYFTTYDWDASGIKYDENRVVGYRIMPCNLGAKEFEPEKGDPTVTYGPLYQWGRKDPFPSMKNTGTGTSKTSGLADYNTKSIQETKGNSIDGVSSNSKTGSNIHVYDNSNNQITLKGTGYTDERAYDTSGTVLYDGAETVTDRRFLFGTVKTSDTSTKGGIKFSINHPTTFIAAATKLFRAESNDYSDSSNYTNGGDWLSDHDDKLWGGTEMNSAVAATEKHREVKNDHFYFWQSPSTINDIWPWMWDNYGTEKTIFDPSPKGWRVPPQDFWIGFTSIGECINQYYFSNNGKISASITFNSFIAMVNCTDSRDDIRKNNGMYLYLSAWKTGEYTFFPCPGTRLGSGQPQHLGICGNYHCASAAPICDGTSEHNVTLNQRVNCFHIHADQNGNQYQVNPFECQRLYVLKSIAGPIRCVLDTK